MKWENYNEKCIDGKIYRIKDLRNENFEYIGSTYRDLNIRFKEHQKKTSDDMCLFEYVRRFYLNDWSSMYIELLFNYPCNNIKQLRLKETETILKKKPFNFPTKIEIFFFNKNNKDIDEKTDKDDRIIDEKTLTKYIKKQQIKILKNLDWDDDNNIVCPFCQYKFKFFSIYPHINSKYHEMFSK